MDGILDTIKLMLGYLPDYNPFDVEITVHINSAFRTLNQLGVGKQGFLITGSKETWEEFLGDQLGSLDNCKTYIYLYVRLLHDPPTNSFIVTKFNEEMKELEWRMNVDAETPSEVNSK